MNDWELYQRFGAPVILHGSKAVFEVDGKRMEFDVRECDKCKQRFPEFAGVSAIGFRFRCRPCNTAKVQHDRNRGAVCSFCGATYDWCCC